MIVRSKINSVAKMCKMFGVLRAEQEMIISQADGHLKCAKGKAMLPQIGKKEVEHIFEVN